MISGECQKLPLYICYSRKYYSVMQTSTQPSTPSICLQLFSTLQTASDRNHNSIGITLEYKPQQQYGRVYKYRIQNRFTKQSSKLQCNIPTLKRVQYCSNNFRKAICLFLAVKFNSIHLSRVVSPLVKYRRGLVVF